MAQIGMFVQSTTWSLSEQNLMKLTSLWSEILEVPSKKILQNNKKNNKDNDLYLDHVQEKEEGVGENGLQAKAKKGCTLF